MKKNAISLSIAALSLSFANFGLAHAQAPTPQQSYQEALAQCKNLSGDARINCQRDVHAAHNDKNRKHMSPDRQMLEKNRIARCNRLPESQRQHCIEQMQGKHHTKTYGSVHGGGMLRHTTIEVPGEPYEVTRPVSRGAGADQNQRGQHGQGMMTPTPQRQNSERVVTPIN